MSEDRTVRAERIRELRIPSSLLPRDGRFGSGPSRVREEQLAALSAVGRSVVGTSHRQAPVREVVRRVRTGLSQLLGLPEGYEIVLGNGGSTAFWDVAAAGLIERRAQNLVFGEFSQKFAVSASAPHLEAPRVIRADPGQLAQLVADSEVDVYAWPHNETSTGVMAPVRRPEDASAEQLVLIDATSAAGAVQVDLSQSDAYYFAPQKAFGSEGGLWLAALSPAALERAERLSRDGSRWIPPFLSLTSAIENSRKNQTLNTPAISTLVLLAEQIDWILGQGGLSWADARTRATSGLLQDWAQRREEASPFVASPQARSQTVTTIDLVDSLDAEAITSSLRAQGILDIEPYRKLGRNQLRIATFPAVDEGEVEALLGVLDFVLDHSA